MISGFQASDIGQVGIAGMDWWQNSYGYTSYDPWAVGGGESPFWDVPFSGVWDAVIASVGQTRSPSATILAFPTGTRIPTVQPGVDWVEEGPLLETDTGDESVGESPTFEPGNEWYSRTPPTDWEKVYDAYQVLNEPEEDMAAFDWGTLAGSVLTQYAASQFAPQVQSLAAAPPPSPSFGGAGASAPVTVPTGVLMPAAAGCSTCPTGSPRYAKICTATGEITPLRRRRRRRLLTAGDLSDIASLKAIVGGGAALNAAVVKAMK